MTRNARAFFAQGFLGDLNDDFLALLQKIGDQLGAAGLWATVAVASAVPVLRAASAIIAASAVASTAASGILHARAEIVPNLRLRRLRFLRQWVFGMLGRTVFSGGRHCFGFGCVGVIQFFRWPDHSFRLGLCFRFEGFGVFGGGFLYIQGGFFRFGNAGSRGFRVEGSFFRVARGFVALRFGNVLGDGSGFFLAQVWVGMNLTDCMGVRMLLRFVDFVSRELRTLLMRFVLFVFVRFMTMSGVFRGGHRKRGALGRWRFVRFPFREALAGKRLKTGGGKRWPELGVRLRSWFLSGFADRFDRRSRWRCRWNLVPLNILQQSRSRASRHGRAFPIFRERFSRQNHGYIALRGSRIARAIFIRTRRSVFRRRQFAPIATVSPAAPSAASATSTSTRTTGASTAATKIAAPARTLKAAAVGCRSKSGSCRKHTRWRGHGTFRGSERF